MLMSMSPEPPQRLGEILMEILELSKPKRNSESESASGNDPIESFDAHCGKEQSQPGAEEENNRQRS
jgi:hypothetical protein